MNVNEGGEDGDGDTEGRLLKNEFTYQAIHNCLLIAAYLVLMTSHASSGDKHITKAILERSSRHIPFTYICTRRHETYYYVPTDIHI